MRSGIICDSELYWVSSCVDLAQLLNWQGNREMKKHEEHLRVDFNRFHRKMQVCDQMSGKIQGCFDKGKS